MEQTEHPDRTPEQIEHVDAVVAEEVLEAVEAMEATTMEFQLGSLVSVEGRIGVLSWDARPMQNFVVLTWQDDGSESEVMPISRLEIINPIALSPSAPSERLIPTAPPQPPVGQLNDGADAVCVVCLDQPRDTAISPCGHLCGCWYCLEKIQHSASPICPICRGPARSIVSLKWVPEIGEEGKLTQSGLATGLSLEAQPGDRLGLQVVDGGRLTAVPCDPVLASIDSAAVCVLCHDAPRDSVVVPCGHFCGCHTCLDSISSCPVCQTPAQASLRIFSS